MGNVIRVPWSISALVLACLLAMGAPVVAQDSTVAEQLFREGKRLMGDGKFGEACKAFEGSYRKDAALSTLLNLADCREKNGQYASAWGTYLDVERLARGDAGVAAFAKTAKERAAKLEPKLSYLVINVTADVIVEGLEILRNGVAIDAAEWNVAIPVDGGEHKVDASAAGFEAWTTTVTVNKERDRQMVDVPKLRATPNSRSPRDDDGAGPAAVPAIPVSQDDRAVVSGEGGGSRTLAKLSVAGGGALILTGLVFGYLAEQKWAAAEELCGADHTCDSDEMHATGQDLVESARLRGNISTISAALGVAAVGVGAILWLRSGRERGGRRADRAPLRLTPVVMDDIIGVVVGSSL